MKKEEFTVLNPCKKCLVRPTCVKRCDVFKLFVEMQEIIIAIIICLILIITSIVCSIFIYKYIWLIYCIVNIILTLYTIVKNSGGFKGLKRLEKIFIILTCPFIMTGIIIAILVDDRIYNLDKFACRFNKRLML